MYLIILIFILLYIYVLHYDINIMLCIIYNISHKAERTQIECVRPYCTVYNVHTVYVLCYVPVFI